MFTARVIQHWGLVGTYLVPSYPKQFGHTTNTRFGGSRKPFFASGVDSRNNHLHLEIRLSTHIIGISLELKTKKIFGWKKVKTRTWMPCWNNRVQKFATFSSRPGGREQVHIFFICKDIFTWAKPKISQHLFTKISENVTHTLYSPNRIF